MVTFFTSVFYNNTPITHSFVWICKLNHEVVHELTIHAFLDLIQWQVLPSLYKEDCEETAVHKHSTLKATHLCSHLPGPASSRSLNTQFTSCPHKYLGTSFPWLYVTGKEIVLWVPPSKLTREHLCFMQGIMKDSLGWQGRNHNWLCQKMFLMWRTTYFNFPAQVLSWDTTQARAGSSLFPGE